MLSVVDSKIIGTNTNIQQNENCIFGWSMKRQFYFAPGYWQWCGCLDETNNVEASENQQPLAVAVFEWNQ